jgi:hypothetical protein
VSLPLPPYGERRQGPFVERSAHLDDCLLREEVIVSGFARNMMAATLVGDDEIGASTRPGPDL